MPVIDTTEKRFESDIEALEREIVNSELIYT